MTFACNPDESAGLAEQFSEKVCRYVVYECWQDVVAEIAECDTKEAIGTMLVQLADDRAEIDSPAKVMAIWDRLEERWITGTR